MPATPPQVSRNASTPALCARGAWRGCGWVDQMLQSPADRNHERYSHKGAGYADGAAQGGERPRARPVMIPTHTSRAPAAAVERSFRSGLTGSDLFPKKAAQGTTRLPVLLLASIHPSAWKANSQKYALRGFSEVRQTRFKVHLFGVASLLAMLLHWVQSLPTGAWGQEHRGCASYRSNTKSALSKWHRLLWRNTCESDRIHKIRITRGSWAQRGGKTYP